ncbi:MAG: hypothetical protein K6E31_02660 [bacterium]|nr:hypothetical protein [bacterium]
MGAFFFAGTGPRLLAGAVFTDAVLAFALALPGLPVIAVPLGAFIAALAGAADAALFCTGLRTV